MSTKRLLFLIFLLMFIIPVFSQEIKIVITAGMNGAFADCLCGEGPSGSMARLKTFSELESGPDDIWIDAGNFTTTYPYPEFNRFILEHLQTLPYDFMLPGENETVQGNAFCSLLRKQLGYQKILTNPDTLLNINRNGMDILFWFIKERFQIPPKLKQFPDNTAIVGIFFIGREEEFPKNLLQTVSPAFIFFSESDSAKIDRWNNRILCLTGGIEAFHVPVVTVRKTKMHKRVTAQIIDLLAIPENKIWLQAYNRFKEQTERRAHE